MRMRRTVPSLPDCPLCGAKPEHLEWVNTRGDAAYVFCNCCGRIARISLVKSEVH